MNLPSYSVRYLIKILSYAKGGMEITKEEATKGLGFLSPRKATTKAKAFKRARSARKAAESEKHRLSTKEIRAAVVERADEVCELPVLCLRMGNPTELHHMESGSGRRREKQSVANTVLLCMTDHRGYHQRPEEYRHAVSVHCSKYGLPLPTRFLREPRGRLVECDRCDGCGWYEGGPTIKTTCTRCGGSGSVPAPQAPESLPERIAK